MIHLICWIHSTCLMIHLMIRSILPRFSFAFFHVSPFHLHVSPFHPFQIPSDSQTHSPNSTFPRFHFLPEFPHSQTTETPRETPRSIRSADETPENVTHSVPRESQPPTRTVPSFGFPVFGTIFRSAKPPPLSPFPRGSRLRRPDLKEPTDAPNRSKPRDSREFHGEFHGEFHSLKHRKKRAGNWKTQNRGKFRHPAPTRTDETPSPNRCDETASSNRWNRGNSHRIRGNLWIA